MGLFLTGLGVTFALATVAVVTGGKAIGGGDIKVFGLIVVWPSVLRNFCWYSSYRICWPPFTSWRESCCAGSRMNGQTGIPFAPYILAGVILSYGLVAFNKSSEIVEQTGRYSCRNYCQFVRYEYIMSNEETIVKLDSPDPANIHS